MRDDVISSDPQIIMFRQRLLLLYLLSLFACQFYTQIIPNNNGLSKHFDQSPISKGLIYFELEGLTRGWLSIYLCGNDLPYSIFPTITHPYQRSEEALGYQYLITQERTFFLLHFLVITRRCCQGRRCWCCPFCRCPRLCCTGSDQIQYIRQQGGYLQLWYHDVGDVVWQEGSSRNRRRFEYDFTQSGRRYKTVACWGQEEASNRLATSDAKVLGWKSRKTTNCWSVSHRVNRSVPGCNNASLNYGY